MRRSPRPAGLLVALTIGAARVASGQYLGLTQWTTGPGANGHWYAITQAAGDFRDMEAIAESFGAIGVSITSANENLFVYNSFVGLGTCAPVWCQPATFYIGLERTSPGGPFAWLNGDALGFTAWNAGEPNNEGGVEMVGHMFQKDGQVLWNDIAFNSNPMREVIEWNGSPPGLSTVPEPATVSLVALGLAGIVGVRRKRNRA